MEQELGSQIMQRWTGPLHLRLIVQPLVAVAFALRDGRRDGIAGTRPYVQRLLTSGSERRDGLASAWGSVGKVLTLAFCLDLAFQIAARDQVILAEAAMMAVILCALPYTLVRGPASRLLRH